MTHGPVTRWMLAGFTAVAIARGTASAAPTATSGCVASKQKATGTLAKKELYCYAKATQRGLSLDRQCIGASEAKLRGKFARSEATQTCLTSGDADTIIDATAVYASETACALEAAIAPALTSIDITNHAGTGHCGVLRNAAGSVLRHLSCNGLNLGDGASVLPEVPVAEGAMSRFEVTNDPDEPSEFTLRSAPSGSTPAGISCTAVGCPFGTPQEVANGGLSTCAVSSIAAEPSGTVNVCTRRGTATIPLVSRVVVTGNAAQPCARCSKGGSPQFPGAGACDANSVTPGAACVSTNPRGLSNDCQPAGSEVISDFAVTLSDLRNDTTVSAAADGKFCPGQSNPGAFGEPEARTIEVYGEHGQAGVLSSIFCVAATGNVLVDGGAGLPGPGTISLVATVATNP